MAAARHLPLTPETLARAYDYLASTPPFARWNLPDAGDLTFTVAQHPHLYGWHDSRGRGRRKRHIIAISARSVGHTASLMTVMAHEMLHLHQALTGQDSAGTEHNAAFRKDAAAICAVHGFDAKAF